MEKYWRKLEMFIPTLIMGILALIFIFIGYSRGQKQHIIGMEAALKMTIEILPLLFLSFVVAAMVQLLIPTELLSKWVGRESGWRGIFIGTVVGGFTPGGPYVSLPIVAGLLKAGASMGTVVAFLTSWSLWAIARLPLEIGILGVKFTMVRFLSTFFFAPIAGFIAQIISTRIK